MVNERWHKMEMLFHKALEQNPESRAAFLRQACSDDLNLHQEVTALLVAAEEAQEENFLGNASEIIQGVWSQEGFIGQIIDEKYQIESLLGSGGMGTVFRATHLGTGRPVAIKIIASQLMAHKEFVERFKREAKATGLLRHPNVVDVTDFGFSRIGSDHLAYLVMEYLDGCTLANMIKKEGQLPLPLVLDIVEQVSAAIDTAHKQGIIHRDLKPENIWLVPNGRGGYHVKVLDFGLAKLRDVDSLTNSSQPLNSNLPVFAPLLPLHLRDRYASTEITMAKDISGNNMLTNNVFGEPTNGKNTTGNINPTTIPSWLTRVGTIMGTPLYMSPEQCTGASLDNRSDIYSLGIITYEMLAGETPFTGDIYKLIAKHNQMPPPPLREKRRDLSKAVADQVMSALAKSVGDRPITATAFASGLRARMEGSTLIGREADTLFQQHRSTFIKLSTLIYTPFIGSIFAVKGLIYLLDMLVSAHIKLSFPPILEPLFPLLFLVVTWLLPLCCLLFSGTVNSAAATLVLAQLRQAPKQPIEIATILNRLIPQLKALISTRIKGNLRVFANLFKLVVPGGRTYLNNALSGSVVVMEGLQGSSALQRSEKLVAQLPSAVVTSQFIDLVIGVLVTQPIFTITIIALTSMIKEGNMVISSFLLVLGCLLLPTMVYPRLAIIRANLYFKTRQIAGDSSFLEDNISKLLS